MREQLPRRRGDGGRTARWSCLALLLCAGCTPRPAEHVLLITIDTLRADRVGCYAQAPGIATPALDRLAAEGHRFTRATALTPTTLPSHATILTGRTPEGHGALNNGAFRLAETVPTVAEAFRTGGFATGAFVGSIILDRVYGLDRGFERYDDQVSGVVEGAFDGRLRRRGAEVARAAGDWLARQGDRRRFGWVHLYDPHSPYLPPSPGAGASPGDPYQDCVAAADAAVGSLRAALEARGLWEETLVVVLADHGEGLGDHGERYHGIFLYETTLRVPLIIAGPGVDRSGTVRTELVSTLDVTPTLLAGAGLPGLAGPGRSLLEDREDAPALPLATWVPPLDYGWAFLSGVRTPTRKYLRAPRAELYDLAADPEERRNLWADRPEQIADRETATRRAAATTTTPPPPRTPGAPAPDRRRQLISLGYVGGGPDLPISPAGADPKDRMDLVDPIMNAHQAWKAGDLAEAARRFTAVLDRDPGNVVLQYYLADLTAQRGEWPAAIAHCRAVLAREPAFGRAHYLLGSLFLQTREFAQAYTHLTAAEELLTLPEAELDLRLGTAAVGTDRLVEARTRLDRYRQERPHDPDGLYALARVAAREGREEEAITRLQEAFRGGLALAPEAAAADPAFQALRRRPALWARLRALQDQTPGSSP